MALRAIPAIVAISVFGIARASAAPEAGKPKPPSAVKALQAAARSLAKAESYRAKVDIEGGLTDREDHQVTERTVGEAYEGEVFSSRSGSLMHIPKVETPTMRGVKAFRYQSRGTAYIQGAWRDILSDRSTVRLSRLFAFPETILARAVANAQSAKWLDAGPGDAAPAGAAEAKDAPPAPDGGGASGKGGSPTAAVKPKAEERPPPRIVRVEAPPREALQNFTEVQNSGCMSGG